MSINRELNKGLKFEITVMFFDGRFVTLCDFYQDVLNYLDEWSNDLKYVFLRAVI